jgi:hypothetical protein
LDLGDRSGDAIDCTQLPTKCIEGRFVQLGEKLGREGAAEFLFNHQNAVCEASTSEAQICVLLIDVETMVRQSLAENAGSDWFGVDENPVTIENDEPWSHSAKLVRKTKNATPGSYGGAHHALKFS